MISIKQRQVILALALSLVVSIPAVLAKAEQRRYTPDVSFCRAPTAACELLEEDVRAARETSASELMEERTRRLLVAVRSGRDILQGIQDLQNRGRYSERDARIEEASHMFVDGIATVRDMAASKDARWLEVLEEAGDTRFGQSGWTTMHGGVAAYLVSEAIRAWYLIELSDVGLVEGVARIGAVLPTGSVGKTLHGAHLALLRRLIHEHGWVEPIVDLLEHPEPAVRYAVLGQIGGSHRFGINVSEDAWDRVVDKLLDPDPQVRGRTERLLGLWRPEAPHEPRVTQAVNEVLAPRVPALLRFLEREGIPEEAREKAIQALRAAGHNAVNGGDSWRLDEGPLEPRFIPGGQKQMQEAPAEWPECRVP